MIHVLLFGLRFRMLDGLLILPLVDRLVETRFPFINTKVRNWTDRFIWSSRCFAENSTRSRSGGRYRISRVAPRWSKLSRKCMYLVFKLGQLTPLPLGYAIKVFVRKRKIHIICSKIEQIHLLMPFAAARTTLPAFTGVAGVTTRALLARAPLRLMIQKGRDFDCVCRGEQCRQSAKKCCGRDLPHIVHADPRRARF